jgi:hypothetical protein
VSFNQATRQNFLSAPTITYAAGQTVPSQLPKVGLLRRIFLLFSGTMTITLGGGTAVLGQEAPFSLITRMTLVANGNTAIFDTSGWGGMIASLFSAFGFSGFGSRPVVPDSATAPGPVATGFSALNYAAGVSAGANTWRFAIEIPLGLSDDWRPPIGLILAAAPDTQLTLNVTFGGTLYSTTASRTTPVTVTGAATAALTGTVTPVVEFFTIPARTEDYPDLRRVHTWTEVGPQGITANGPQQVIVGRGNTIMRIVHIVHTNTLPDSTNVTGRTLSYNQNEIPYSTTLQGDAVIQRKRYVRDLPDGTYVWDLWNSGTPRDAVNTLNLNELISTLTLSGATIAGTSDIRTLVEQLITLTGAVAGSA